MKEKNSFSSSSHFSCSFWFKCCLAAHSTNIVNTTSFNKHLPNIFLTWQAQHGAHGFSFFLFSFQFPFSSILLLRFWFFTGKASRSAICCKREREIEVRKSFLLSFSIKVLNSSTIESNWISACLPAIIVCPSCVCVNLWMLFVDALLCEWSLKAARWDAPVHAECHHGPNCKRKA